MALDVMEACRPVVDAYVLTMLTQRTLSPRDFIETSRGTCRLRPTFARELAQCILVWASHIAPVAEHAASDLAHAADAPAATLLTQDNRSAAWATRRTNPKTARTQAPRLPERCRDCGGSLPSRRRRYCEDCRERRHADSSVVARQQAAQVLDHLRAEGRDPAHGGTAARARGRKNAAHQLAVRVWETEHGSSHDPAVFAERIAPRLRGVPIHTLTEATGLSEHYCSLVRLGKRIPHARHWAALERTLG